MMINFRMNIAILHSVFQLLLGFVCFHTFIGTHYKYNKINKLGNTPFLWTR